MQWKILNFCYVFDDIFLWLIRNLEQYTEDKILSQLFLKHGAAA